MQLFDEFKQKRGNTLITVNGYDGEDDFYRLYNVIREVLMPDDIGYSFDSMCIGGYFVKDGITIRFSSECPYDCCCFLFCEDALSPDQNSLVRNFINTVLVELHKRHPKQV